MNERKGQSEGPQAGKGLAIAALVLGVCSIIPVLGVMIGIAAVGVSIIALAARKPGKAMAIAGGILGIALPFVWFLGGPSPNRSVKIMCGTNFATITRNLWLYMADRGFQVPPDVETLIRVQGLSRELLQCPAVKVADEPSVFVLFPKTEDVPKKTLVGCDYRGNHGDLGRNVLRFDGTVLFLREADFQRELARPENAAFAAALRAKEGP